MKIPISTFCSFCLLIISFMQAVAQGSDTYSSKRQWSALKSYSIADGLPSKNTTATIQDRRGFIWVGTQNGLCRFDGFGFKIFSTNIRDKKTITNNYINALCEDKQGNLWVATMDGLNRFDPDTETFERFYHHKNDPASLSNNKVWSLLCDRKGIIWIGTDDGFNKYLPKQRAFRVYKPDSSKKGRMQGKSVNAIIEDEHDNLWLGNWSAGLNKFSPQTELFVNYPQPQTGGEKNPNDIWALSGGKSGSIWVGTYWNGLFHFDVATGKFSSVSYPQKRSYSVFNIMPIDSSSLLINSSIGTHLYDRNLKKWLNVGTIRNYANSHSYLDRQGNVWINAVGGLYLINHQQYSLTLKPLPLLDAGVRMMLSSQKNIWIATDRGLIKINEKNGVTKIFRKGTSAQSLPDNNVSNVYLDHEANLWVLTEDGFACCDEGGNIFKKYHHNSTLGTLFNEDVFRDILEIQKDVYLLATDAGIKIFYRRTGRFEHYHNETGVPSSLTNNHTYKLAQSPDGKVWIGTYGGGVNVFDYSRRTFRAITTENGLESNVINDILIDTKKNIWISTPDGLAKFDSNRRLLASYSRKDGFASNIFKTLAEDASGIIWVTTENGVSSLDPVSNLVRNFDESDGFLVNSIVIRSGNRMIVGGSKGYFSWHIGILKSNTPAPRVFLTDFQVFNQSVLPDQNGPLKENINIAREITLGHDDYTFSIEYVSPSYLNPAKTRYEYRLVGFDKGWNAAGNHRKATYTNLNAGIYRFEVRAAADNETLTSTITSLVVKIKPPWYLSFWAYLVYSILVLLTAYLYLAYRKKRNALNFEAQLARMQREKEKEFNEQKSSFFVNITHEFRTPLTLIINPVKDLMGQSGFSTAKNGLDSIYRNAKRLLVLVDQLISVNKMDEKGDQLRVSSVNIVDFSREVFFCFEHQAKKKRINYDFRFCTNNPEIYADARKLEIVLFNLLSNAFKFTPPGGSIMLTIAETEQHLTLEVKDTGRGIAESEQNKIFNRFYQQPVDPRSMGDGFGIGLYLVKSFVELHGGSVHCSANQPQGTIFHVALLKGDTHLTPSGLLQRADSEANLPIHTSSHYLEQSTEDFTGFNVDSLRKDRKTILIVDDNEELAGYLSDMFASQYQVWQAWNGENGLAMIYELLPDIVISDVMMGELGGIELCQIVKQDDLISHIPIVLLTASNDEQMKLRAMEIGADDFLNKPFDNTLLIARIANILERKNSLQKYFYNEITLNPNQNKISAAYHEFLNNCIAIVEKHMEDPEFSIKVLAQELGMSRENVFKKIKSISGHSSTSFIRFIRLRKAAEIFINTENTIRETMFIVGISDLKYFRAQFKKVFGMNPSDYIRKYRKIFSNKLSLHEDLKRKDA